VVDAVLSGVRLVDGVLQIVGTNGDDTVIIRRPLDPIAYYSFDETSGTLVADQAGTPQNGTVFTANNQPTRLNVPGAEAGFDSGTAIELTDNTRNYVAVAHDPVFELENGTFQLWFNADRLQNEQMLFSKDRLNRDSGGHFTVRLFGGTLSVRLQDTQQDYFIQTGNLVSANTWYHLAVSFGDEGMKLYLNGELVGTNPFTGGIETNPEPLVIGGGINRNSDRSGDLSRLQVNSPFDGRIDEFAIYGEALSADAIARLFAQGVAATSGSEAEIEVFASFLDTPDQRIRFNVADINAVSIQLGDGNDDLSILTDLPDVDMK